MRQRGTRKKNSALRLTAMVLFAVGLILFFYPIVSNVLYVIESNNRFSQYEQQIEDIKNSESSSEKSESQNDESKKSESSKSENSKNDSSDDEQPKKEYTKEYLSELYEKMKSYNDDLYKTGQPKLIDPFSYEQSPFDLTEYGLSDNMIGYIDIPKMEQKLPLMLGATWENMGQGAAYMANTSLPIGGENTNCVIAGHRGMTYALMFRYIEWLENGDDVYIKNLWETLHYKVTKIEIINPTDMDKIRIQKGKDMVTLVTCHPYPYNYQRYVVYCERVTDNADNSSNSSQSNINSGTDSDKSESSNTQTTSVTGVNDEVISQHNALSLEQLELVIQITVTVLLVSLLAVFVAATLIRRRRNKNKQ